MGTIQRDFEVEEGARGVGGIGVDVAELRRIVGADGKQREFGREAASDFAEAGEVGGVAGVIDGMLAGLQNKAAVAAMRIFQNARSPVARGYVRDGKIAVARSLPPVEFDDFGKAEIGNQIGNVSGNDDRRRDSAACAGCSARWRAAMADAGDRSARA